MKKAAFPLTLLTASCVILAGCEQCSQKKTETKTAEAPGSSIDSNKATPTTPSASKPTEERQPGAPSTAGESGGTTSLQINDIKVGSGPEAVDGKKVTVNYTGTLTNGTKFDSTKDRGTPFSFVLGSGMVVAGWDQGVKGMKEGGVRKLVIPPSLAYGNSAVGGIIPPNSTLIFEIELLKVE